MPDLINFLNSPHIKTLVDSFSPLIALLALSVSVYSIFLSKKLQTSSDHDDGIEKQYDTFNELSKIRLNHQDMNHLFALPELYEDRLHKVRISINATNPQKQSSIELKEEAVSMLVFQVFEQTYYQRETAVKTKNKDRAKFLNEVLEYLTGRLLRNPRLRYFWDNRGGNCCTYFEQCTQEFYRQNVLKNPQLDYIDFTGPFYERRPNWNISHDNTLSSEEREEYWTKTHQVDDYETVWSMTDDVEVQNKIIQELNEIKAEKVLIPGCGSKTALQEAILNNVSTVTHILCTDFDGVIEVAKIKNSQFNDIEYKAINSVDIPRDSNWDAVVVVNSVLSESHQENLEMLETFFGALKPRGRLIGFFPTIFCSLDIALAAGNVSLFSNINSVKSSFYEEKQGIWQIFYTPLRLRKILNDIGYKRISFEVYFCDSSYFIKHSREYYGLKDPDSHVYEHFIVAEKP